MQPLSDGEKSVIENTIQLSNETSNFDETWQAFPQIINSQSSYDEESRISVISSTLLKK